MNSWLDYNSSVTTPIRASQLKAKQSWLLDSHFCMHALLQVPKNFHLWQFAPHGFSNIFLKFIIVLMRLFELFSIKMNNTSYLHIFKALKRETIQLCFAYKRSCHWQNRQEIFATFEFTRRNFSYCCLQILCT